ncbi:hypothetical protein DKL61_07800 [Gammaproteobacteria bacterium ESL0073]|nr:hypothetical protein DKL61_07800 [Gammaproteobacteria bacterium ESL0073]
MLCRKVGILTAKSSLEINDRTPFLPSFNFYEKHESQAINASDNEIIEAIYSRNLNDDKVTHFLMSLRELPARLFNKSMRGKETFGLKNFTLLYRSDNEISLGLVGKFWRADFGLCDITNKDEFINLNDPQVSKLVLRFKVIKQNNENIVKTETFVYCPSMVTKSVFSCYWLAIRFFSGLIRKRMLNNLKSFFD